MEKEEIATNSSRSGGIAAVEEKGNMTRNGIVASGWFWMLAALLGSACLLLAPSPAHALLQFEGCEECVTGMENPQGLPIHWFEHNTGNEDWDCESSGSGCHLDEKDGECDWVHDECIPDPLVEEALDAIATMIASRDARTLAGLVALGNGRFQVNGFTNTLDVFTCGRVLETQFALPEELAALVQEQQLPPLFNDLRSDALARTRTDQSPGSHK